MAEDIPNAESPVQHEIIVHEADTGATETSNALTDVHDEQADIVEVPVVTSNPIGSATPEPIITSCSEQVTFMRTNSEPADSFIDVSCSNFRYVHRALIFQVCFPLTRHQWV